MKTDPAWEIRQSAVYAFRQIPTENPVILKALIEVMLHDEVWGIREGAAEALRQLDSKESSIQQFKPVWEGSIH
jgi:HEAT repeat protein